MTYKLIRSNRKSIAIEVHSEGMSCVRYGDGWYNRPPMSILAMIAGTETYSGGLVWQ